MTQQQDNPQTDTGRPRRRWKAWLRDIALLLVAFTAIQWWQARSLVEGDAPLLTGLLLDGSPYQLQPGDGPVLVHFWATWCPVCRLEQDSIDEIAADRPVITVATTSGTRDELTAYLREHGLSMPVLLDEDGDIARNWGVDGVPATFVVDRDGKIRFAAKGYSTGIGLRLRLWLAG